MSVRRRILPVAAATVLCASVSVPAVATAAPTRAPAASEASAPAEATAVSPKTLRGWQSTLITGTNQVRAQGKVRTLRASNCLSRAGAPIAKRFARAGKTSGVTITKAEAAKLAACTPAGKRRNTDWKYGFVWGSGFRSGSAQMSAMRANPSSVKILRHPSFTQVGAATAVGRRGEVWGVVFLAD